MLILMVTQNKSGSIKEPLLKNNLFQYIPSYFLLPGKEVLPV